MYNIDKLSKEELKELAINQQKHIEILEECIDKIDYSISCLPNFDYLIDSNEILEILQTKEDNIKRTLPNLYLINEYINNRYK